MTEQLLIALLNFGVKFGIDAAIAAAKAKDATIDEAIAALELAKTKSLAQYKLEDKQTSGQ